MPSRQFGVNRGGRQSLAAIGVGQPVRARNRQDQRVVDAVAGQCRLTAVDVADEVRVRVTPLQDGAIRPHYGPPQVRLLIGEQGILRVVAAVRGQSHLERGGLAVQGASLVIDRHGDGDVASRRDGSDNYRRGGSDNHRWRRRDVLLVDFCRRGNRFDLDRMLDPKHGRR